MQNNLDKQINNKFFFSSPQFFPLYNFSNSTIQDKTDIVQLLSANMISEEFIGIPESADIATPVFKKHETLLLHLCRV